MRSALASSGGRSIRRPLIAGKWLGVALLVAGGLLSAHSIQRLASSSAWVARTLTVVDGLQEIHTALAHLEVGTRSYVLSGRAAERTAAMSAASTLHRETAEVRALTQDNPGQQSRFARLERAIRGRTELAQEVLLLRDRYGLERSARVALSENTAESTRQIRGQLRQIEKVEHQLLAKRQEDLRGATTRSLALTAVTTLIGAVLVTLTGVFAARENTRHLQARAELQQTLDHLHQATAERDRFFALSLDILVIATPDGLFKFASPGVTRILGWTVPEFLSMPYMEQVHPEDARATGEQVTRQVERGEPVLHFENRYRRKDGTYRVLSWTSMAHTDRLMYAIARDVTEEHRARRALRAATVEAERANQAKSQFLATMSHELRTPLNAIIGFSEMLADRTFGELNEKQARYVENVLSSGRHLLELINDILDLAKVESGRMELHRENTDIREAIESVLNIVRSLTQKKQIQLECTIAEGLAPIFVDRSKFKQVLYNLLSNAAKFTPEEGVIAVAAGRTVALVENAPEPIPALRLLVRDNGVGIRPEDQNRIWKAFEQIDGSMARQVQGTGLGLTLTRKLVEMHGGRIYLESTGVPGEGCTFAVELPLDVQARLVPETAESLPAQEPVRPPGTKGALLQHGQRPRSSPERPLILIVEDDPAAAYLLDTYLSTGGYDVALAKTAAEALELAVRLEPAAITLDILLPDKIGWEVLGELKGRPATADIPVVIVSVTDNRELAFTLGAVDVLVKPILRGRLLGALDLAAQRIGKRLQKLLVVDDERDALASLSSILSAAGYTVFTAESGALALESVLRDQPDAVVLDLVMPDMSGFEVVQHLRANPLTLGLPVFVYTGRTLTAEEVSALRGRVQGITAKPAAEQLLSDLMRLTERSESTSASVHGSPEGLHR